ncbi:hypothetical protein GALMADRAFT_160763 [Galerina marginata CBS 339.88]|uniref:MYND-type domain-containing protein n=1 Tax=Galerina marginata (strain CBS 339.88) TaxID=685588 RepID=A0A067SLU4_GALM3|nr:hypothetical protein GALMADRAFT_160763 [Galerina marginata CBS 339.88]
MDYVPTGTANCPCTDDTCPTFIAQRRLQRLGPRASVAAAADEQPDSPFLTQLANITLSDPHIRRSGAATMFIRHILEGKSTDNTDSDSDSERKRHWEIPAMGIINIFAGIFQSHSEVQDAAILREIHSSYRGILEVIWKDFPSLSPAGPAGDSRRFVAAKMINFFLHNAEMKRSMYDEKTINLVLYCWLVTSPDSTVRIEVAHTVDVMFAARDPFGNRPPPQYLQLAFKAYNIKTFVSQVNFSLKHKKMLGQPLTREISVLCEFVRVNDPFVPHFLEAGVHRQVAAAVRRQLKNARAEDESVTREVLEESGIFMQHLLQQAKDTMAMFTDLLANTCMVEIGAAALKLANKSGSEEVPAWYEIFEKIKHSMTCKNFNGCEYHATPQFLRAARTSLERVAIPTVIALQEEVVVGGERKYLVQWMALGRVLGITEESIRERYRTDRKCCNLGCPARNLGVQSSKKHTCTVCLSVFYCNRECQKSDWKTHKGECERLRQAAQG